MPVSVLTCLLDTDRSAFSGVRSECGEWIVRRRRSETPSTVRLEPVDRGSAGAGMAKVLGSVHGPRDLDSDCGRSDFRSHEGVGRYGRDSGNRSCQWNHRLSPGRKGRPGAGGAAENVVADGQSHSRWRSAGDPGFGVGTGRHHRTGSRRQYPHRLAAAERLWAPSSGSVADGRIVSR